MKSLDQIEARTPLAGGSSPITISQPGSYYLTGNLFVTSGDAITITTNGVTLDLNGFTISSGANPANGSGVLLAGNNADITILNGHIKGAVIYDGNTYSGPGFLHGISTSGPPFNVRVANVSVSGCLGEGIYLNFDDSTVVESCTVRTVGGYGIIASIVKNSAAVACGFSGIGGDQVSDCLGQSTSSSFGDAGIFGKTALNCYGIATNGNGISAGSVVNCSGSSGNGTGVLAGNTGENSIGASTSGTGLYASTANNCYGFSNSGTGLSANIANNCYGSAGTGTGISTGDGATLIGCTALSSSVGISAGKGCTIQNCTAQTNSSHGITVGDASSVSNCAAKSNGGDGIRVTQYCQVIGNTCYDNGAANDATKAGIHMTGGNNRVENNHAVANKFRGILIDPTGHRNFIIKNTAKDNNGLDFDLAGAGDNQYGQIIPTPGAGFSNSNPWANFAF